MQVSAADQAAFASMLGMLQGWRTATGVAAPGAQPSGPALPTQDLMSILSLMQQDGGPRLPPAGDAEQQSLASQLRQQMTQAYGGEAIRELLELLRANAKIKINKNLM